VCFLPSLLVGYISKEPFYGRLQSIVQYQIARQCWQVRFQIKLETLFMPRPIPLNLIPIPSMRLVNTRMQVFSSVAFQIQMVKWEEINLTNIGINAEAL
jgi:hypothetical protein